MDNSKSSRNCKVLLRAESFLDMEIASFFQTEKNIKGKHMFYMLESNFFEIIIKCFEKYMSQICVQKKQTYLPQGFANHVYFK